MDCPIQGFHVSTGDAFNMTDKSTGWYLLAQVGIKQICLIHLDTEANRRTDPIISSPTDISYNTFCKLFGSTVRNLYGSTMRNENYIRKIYETKRHISKLISNNDLHYENYKCTFEVKDDLWKIE